MKHGPLFLATAYFALAAGLAATAQAAGQGSVEPRFPASPAGLLYLEGEEALSTNFAREPTLDYSSSGFRTLLLNREPRAAGAPFYAEWSILLEEGGTWTLWIGGTPPGPRSELTPSYASPLRLIVDGGTPRELWREDVVVVEPYSLTSHWYAAKLPLELDAGPHTLRIEVSERRRWDTRYYMGIDALFLLAEDSPLLGAKPDGAAGYGDSLPPRFPRDLAERGFDNPWLSIAQYEARIQAEPRDREWYLQLAQVYGMLGDYGAALKILSRGRLVAGDDPRFALMGAKNRVWSGEVDEGLRLYREYLASPGSDPAVWAEAAKVSAWLARYPESLELYREARALFPGDLNLAVNHGLTFLWAGRVKEGEAELAAARESAYAAPGTVKTLASILEVNGYPAEARKALDEGTRRFPDELELRLLAARAALNAGDAEGAAGIEAAIRARFAASPRLDGVLASLEAQAGLRRAALARQEARIAASPDDLELRRELARAYYWNGRLDDAVSAGEDILVNKLFRITLELERELEGTWRWLDILALRRAALPDLARLAKEAAAGLRTARETWKKAGEESVRAAGSKDQARRDKAAEALGSAEVALAGALARAEGLLAFAGRVAAEAEAAGEASAAEAAAGAADKDTLGKLGAWTWRREEDLAGLRADAARGKLLARAVLERVDLIERRPAAVVARAEAAAAAAEAAGSGGTDTPPRLPALERSLAEARLWSSGKAPEGALPADAYFAHAPELLALAAGLEPPPPEAYGGSAFDSGSGEAALAAATRLEEAAASLPLLVAALGRRVDALHERAALRLRLRWYQHDAESAAERRELSDALLKLGRPAEAIVQLERVLAVEPGDLDASFTLGRARELSGDWSGAMERYRLVYSTDPRLGGVASSYNRLAKAHADRVTASAGSSVDSSRAASQGRIEYAAGGTSRMGFGVVYLVEDLRIHSPRQGNLPVTMGLQSLDLSLDLNMPRLGATLFASAGGTLKNRLWSEPSSATEPFEPGDLGGVLAAAPRLGAGFRWAGGPWSASGSYAFAQIKDSFFPGRWSWFEHAGEANLSAWFAFPAPALVRNLSFRAYARGSSVFAPFTAGSNFLYTGLLEATAGFLLDDAPWTTLGLGGNVVVEGARDPSAEDYYAPDGVVSAKGGLQLSTWLGRSGGWITGLSARAWGGFWRDADEAWPTYEGSARVELSKGDLALWLEAAGSRTGGADSAEYWSLQARLGATVAVPGYLIP